MNGGDFEWPPYITFAWPKDLGFLSKRYVLEGLMELILARPKTEWLRGSLNATVANLVIAFRIEKDPRLKCNITLYLRQLLPIYTAGEMIVLPDENLDTRKILNQVLEADISLSDNHATALAKRLEKWIKKVGN